MKYNIPEIVKARMKKGWNQTALAFRAGLSVSTVSLIESGKRQTPGAVAKMAEVLGLQLEDLVIEEELVAVFAQSPSPSKSKRKYRERRTA